MTCTILSPAPSPTRSSPPLASTPPRAAVHTCCDCSAARARWSRARRSGRGDFLHVDQLPVPQLKITGDEALAELATRYIRSHGPVSMKDLVWWSALTVAQAKEAFGLAQGVIGFGDEHLMADWQADVTPAELRAALDRDYELPAFDEILLGYGDKSLILPDEHRPRVLTKNGLSWPFRMSGGMVVGRVE
ncbi:crosslink repair DNA glycosylase YcaQ family protein [Corynebacterium suedekumii]|nr:crosslink repair DNA glycosylase YcaQ family protein [Corynebacterium suedekumii]